MKLILAIIQDEDAPATIQALVDRGYRVTRIASTGGFLRQGNTTLLIGVETVHVPEVMESPAALFPDPNPLSAGGGGGNRAFASPYDRS